MAKFKYPKNPTAYLNHLLPAGWHRWYTQHGIGIPCQCAFCGYRPPDHLKYYSQRWRDVNTHTVTVHHGQMKVPANVGAKHGVERSRERLGLLVPPSRRRGTGASIQ
jgi:hypothetical protein